MRSATAEIMPKLLTVRQVQGVVRLSHRGTLRLIAKRLSLAQLERLAVEIASLGQRGNKCGVVILKRRAGRGCRTPRLVCMTEEVWRGLRGTSLPGGNAEYGEKEGGNPLPTR